MLVRLTAEAYRGLVRSLLPRGVYWRRAADSLWEGLLLAVGDEASRVHGRLLDALAESDPRSTTEMIGDWEAEYGLPDPSAGTPATLAGRRSTVLARVRARGGASPSYFEGLAGALGLTAVVESAPYEPFRVNQNRCNDLLYGSGWAYVWIVHVTDSAGPEPQLEALFDRLKPSHTTAHYSYEG